MGVPEKERADVGIGVSVEGNGEYIGSGVAEGICVVVGIAVCVSAIAVPAKDIAVSATFVGCVLNGS